MLPGCQDVRFGAKSALPGPVAALPDLAPSHNVTADHLAAIRNALAEVPHLLDTRDDTAVHGPVATEAAYRDALAHLDDLVPALIDAPTFVAEYAQARPIPGD